MTPTGTVEVTVKGALKKKTYTLTLNRVRQGAARPAEGPKQVGKIKVKVEYLGDAAVLGVQGPAEDQGREERLILTCSTRRGAGGGDTAGPFVMSGTSPWTRAVTLP